MTSLPLILLPGLNNTAAVFDGLVEALGPQIDARCVTLPALETVEALADELLSGLPSLFHLCGFSFGGYVALAMLEKAPERIAGLALAGSLPGADTDAGRANRAAAIKTAQTGGYEDMVRKNAAAAFHPDSLADEALMAKRAAMVTDYGQERFVAHSRAAMVRADRTATLTAWRGSLIMMAGECDPLAPKEAMVALAGSERVQVVAGAGHLLPMEQPGAMAEILSDWLAGTG